jgi:hypothetical protein
MCVWLWAAAAAAALLQCGAAEAEDPRPPPCARGEAGRGCGYALATMATTPALLELGLFLRTCVGLGAAKAEEMTRGRACAAGCTSSTRTERSTSAATWPSRRGCGTSRCTRESSPLSASRRTSAPPRPPSRQGRPGNCGRKGQEGHARQQRLFATPGKILRWRALLTGRLQRPGPPPFAFFALAARLERLAFSRKYGRDEMKKRHFPDGSLIWTQLQLEKTTVMAAALRDGFDGVLFADADVRCRARGRSAIADPRKRATPEPREGQMDAWGRQGPAHGGGDAVRHRRPLGHLAGADAAHGRRRRGAVAVPLQPHGRAPVRPLQRRALDGVVSRGAQSNRLLTPRRAVESLVRRRPRLCAQRTGAGGVAQALQGEPLLRAVGARGCGPRLWRL